MLRSLKTSWSGAAACLDRGCLLSSRPFRISHLPVLGNKHCCRAAQTRSFLEGKTGRRGRTVGGQLSPGSAQMEACDQSGLSGNILQLLSGSPIFLPALVSSPAVSCNRSPGRCRGCRRGGQAQQTPRTPQHRRHAAPLKVSITTREVKGLGPRRKASHPGMWLWETQPLFPQANLSSPTLGWGGEAGLGSAGARAGSLIWGLESGAKHIPRTHKGPHTPQMLIEMGH